MLKKMLIGAAAAASLTAAALTPAMATIPQCMQTPNPDTCPYGGAPTPKATSAHTQKSAMHSRYRREPMAQRS
jgi:hypothetical protein